VPSSLGIVASGEDVLNDAVLWLDASLSSVSGGKLTNLGKGGSALDAQFGSTTSTDTNDPLLLSHTGTNYLYLPGVSGNDATTPHSAALQTTGDFEIVCRVALDDWTPTAAACLVAKREAAPQMMYSFNVEASGKLSLALSTDGTTVIGPFASSVATSFTDGSAGWVRVARVSGTGTITFYTAADQTTEPTSWTQLGTTVGGTAGALVASTDLVRIGANRVNNNLLAGKFYRAIVRNGIGGTIVFDADFTTGITSGAQTTFTESSANTATVTINRSTSGRKSVAVTRNVLLFGTDDFLEVADNDLLDFGASDSFSVIVLMRQWATPTSFSAYMGKTNNASSTSAGYLIYANPGANVPATFIGDATTAQFNGWLGSPAYTNGNVVLLASVIDRTVQTMRAYSNNNTVATTSTAAIGSLSNALTLRIGYRPGAADMEFVAAAVFRRALTVNEIATITARYT
jgi:hypothetical protein